MNNKIALGVVGAIAAMAMTYQASAVILVGSGNPPDSGFATETQWAKDQITAYNAVNDPNLPSIDGIVGDKSPDMEDGPKSISFTVPDGCDWIYLLTKWGGGNRPLQVDDEIVGIIDTYLHYAEAGETIEFTNPTQLGLSHYIVWCPGEKVPDGGSAMVLLGLGLVGLGMVRRRMSA